MVGRHLSWQDTVQCLYLVTKPGRSQCPPAGKTEIGISQTPTAKASNEFVRDFFATQKSITRLQQRIGWTATNDCRVSAQMMSTAQRSNSESLRFVLSLKLP